MKEFRIRPIEPKDYGQWKPLWDGYNSFYGRSGETALSEAVTQATWQSFFDDSEPVFGAVAESADTVVGIVHYLFHRSTNQLNSVCYLHDLYTDESVRGLGIGKQLIGAVYDHARSLGAPSVHWHTHHTNSTAMRLYDQVATNSGFVVYKALL